MTNMQYNFKNWLKDVKGYKQTTINYYVRHLINAYKNNFDFYNYHLNDSDWKHLSENILHILTKYYEFANKEYYLDRVTIIYALGYFQKLKDYFKNYENLKKDTNKSVKLYLYCYEGSFYIDSISFENLYEYTQLFNSFCYKREFQENEFYHIDIQDFLRKIKNIIETNNISDSSIYDSAIHIMYEQKNMPRKKKSLSLYCDFLFFTTKSTQYDYVNYAMINYCDNKNPKKSCPYTIDKNINGEHSMEISKAYDEKCEHNDSDCVLTLSNLAKIFNTSETSAINLLERYRNNYPEKTILKEYYSINATNECLKKYYYAIPTQNNEVDYKKEGYSYWCQRKGALKILSIGKDAFYKYIIKTKSSTNSYITCSHIEYCNLHKYYIPDLEYLATNPDLKRLSRRKKTKKYK